MNNREKSYQIIANVLKINLSSVNDEVSPENTVSWDSFNALMLISEFERAFNLSFDTDEVVAVRNVRDILEVLKSHGVEFNG